MGPPSPKRRPRKQIEAIAGFGITSNSVLTKRQVLSKGNLGYDTGKELPQFVRDMLASPPRAGEGVNLYLFRMARVLHPYRSETEFWTRCEP